MKQCWILPALLVLFCLAGCGVSGSGSVPRLSADFDLSAAPNVLTVAPGGQPGDLIVTASGRNGFYSPVTFSVSGLPTGVAASPATLTVAPGTLQRIHIAASRTAVAGNANITVEATSGPITHTASASLTVGTPPPSSPIAINASSFNFGDELVEDSRVRTVVRVTNMTSGAVTLNPTLSGNASYSTVPDASCSSGLAAGGTCGIEVRYAPTVVSAPNTQDATLNVGVSTGSSGSASSAGTVSLQGTAVALTPGEVAATDNPQVALYTVNLPYAGTVTVNFGKDATYGQRTSAQSSAADGGTVKVLVAGMQANTTYHMQASVKFVNGLRAADIDHTFTTGSPPPDMALQATAAASAGMTPQPGVEVLNAVNGTPQGVFVTDLAGNVLWTYSVPGNPKSDQIDGVKLLPNGDFLFVVGAISTAPMNGSLPDGTIVELLEVNLAGDVVRGITLDELNSELKAAGYDVTLADFHHDVEPLPNGHWLVLANALKKFSDLAGYSGSKTVLGDVVVDLDSNLEPVWVWNEFDHLDINRHPYMFPDWTHSNAVMYSSGDGNIMVSIRHQNWLVKVDYENGSGSGDVLWRLGEGGDFALEGGTDPQDWFYAQHDPGYFSANTTGTFSIGLMDNGDDRIFPGGAVCGTTGAPACYSTIPVLQVNESNDTATLTFQQILPTALYNNFGGNTEQLANGDVEYDLCGLGSGSAVYEVTQQSTPQTVWQMQSKGTNLYRAFRLPSLYPGVQW